MTTYTLMSNQNEPGPGTAGVPPVPVQIVLEGTPVRCHVTFALSVWEPPVFLYEDDGTTILRDAHGNIIYSDRQPVAPVGVSVPTFGKASLWVQTATSPYGYTEDIPLLTMQIGLGQPSTITHALNLNLSHYQFLFAQLEIIDRSQQIAASMSMVV